MSLISVLRGLASSGSTSPTTGTWKATMQRQAAVKLYGVFACGLKVGLCASKVNFAGHIAGQWSPRWTIHASRQLSDKVLRYLKRVIVTPAVYWSFARLKPGFRYQHWRIQDYTQPSIWQSPMFLLNSRAPWSLRPAYS